MAIKYTNSKDQIYYLHIGKTKKGNPRYSFSLKSKGNLAETIPDGYEIYENPNARVFLRKIQPRLIFEDEVALLKEGLEKYSQLKDYKIDLKKNIISIFIPDQDANHLIEIAKRYNPGNFDIGVILRELTYSAIMQFKLIDKEKRFFITQRYCFFGSIDDWIDIGEKDHLEKLLEKYVKHIGEDSYFELF